MSSDLPPPSGLPPIAGPETWLILVAPGTRDDQRVLTATNGYWTASPAPRRPVNRGPLVWLVVLVLLAGGVFGAVKFIQARNVPDPISDREMVERLAALEGIEQIGPVTSDMLEGPAKLAAKTCDWLGNGDLGEATLALSIAVASDPDKRQAQHRILVQWKCPKQLGHFDKALADSG